MPQISIPVRVLSGSKDPVIPPDIQQRETVSRLANCRLALVSDAGHLLTDEAPEAVGDALRQFLSDLANGVAEQGN